MGAKPIFAVRKVRFHLRHIRLSVNHGAKHRALINNAATTFEGQARRTITKMVNKRLAEVGRKVEGKLNGLLANYHARTIAATERRKTKRTKSARRIRRTTTTTSTGTTTTTTKTPITGTTHGHRHSRTRRTSSKRQHSDRHHQHQHHEKTAHTHTHAHTQTTTQTTPNRLADEAARPTGIERTPETFDANPNRGVPAQEPKENQKERIAPINQTAPEYVQA